MDAKTLRTLLDSVADGTLSPQDAQESLHEAMAAAPFTDLTHAKVDHDRASRCGFPEVVFCQGKTPDQVRSISKEILSRSDVLLATRAQAAHFQSIAQTATDARYHENARLIVVDRREERPEAGHVVVATGGTADIPVAEEAAITAELMGSRVSRLFDVGVAGVHRLLAHARVLQDARVIVAVAGMEGALPSVIAGLVDVPVIAVPTSIGYGAHFGGVAPLLTMLNSCATGIGVVNIDNGFGAGALAARINLLAAGPGDGPAEPR